MQKDGGHLCIRSHLYVNLIICQDGAAISLAETIKLGKVAITSTAFVRKEMKFVNLMKALVTYAVGVIVALKVFLVDLLIKYIINYKISSGFLPMRIRTTCIRYLQQANFLLKIEQFLTL